MLIISCPKCASEKNELIELNLNTGGIEVKDDIILKKTNEPLTITLRFQCEKLHQFDFSRKIILPN
jgi:hypothetical protein